MGLLKTAYDMRNGKLSEYPPTLIDAIQMLGEYAAKRSLFVELNQRVNWGQRADGTLVIFDLAHTQSEIAG